MVRDPEYPLSELRLVLLSACGVWADDEIRRLATDARDWPVVTSIASWELATSAVWRRVEAVSPDIDPSKLVALRRTGMVEEFRMTALEERARRLVSALSEAGIQTLLLKGAGIAAGLPNGFRSRPMGDIDLLARPDQAQDAHAIAKQLGWVERSGGFAPSMYEDMQHLMPLVAADGLGFGLEIHTGLFPKWSPFEVPIEGIWERSLTLDGWAGARIASEEDQLLHTCLHFAWSHMFRRGVWRVTKDVETLLARGLDLDVFLNRLRTAKGTTAGFWTLRLLQDLVGNQFAPDLSTAFGDDLDPRMSGAILRHLEREVLRRSEIPGTRRLGRLLWSAAIRPRAMGHGDARPWSSEGRWPDRTDESPSSKEGLGGRVKGFLWYFRQVGGIT